eukprot:maker-scaffold253_size237113-snap-gene-1.33 protein:Tk00294 transcript:maker-scaffold253_size237113-snap-gene-1.33-mRNA-1 annotation:"innexin unc-7"
MDDPTNTHMQKIQVYINQKTCPRKKHRLAVFLAKRMSDMNSENARWSNKFNLCQALNLVNVVGQFFFTNRFLGGKFLTYGFEVIFYPLQAPESRVDALTIVFPKMTKCIFHAYGGSGTIQKFDALCVLGMNAINEKIFVFLWVWYLLLAAITLIGLVIGLGQYLIPSTRKRFSGGPHGPTVGMGPMTHADGPMTHADGPMTHADAPIGGLMRPLAA